MDPGEFALNLIVADAGVREDRHSYFETLADLLGQFLQAIFGKKQSGRSATRNSQQSAVRKGGN